MPRRRVSPSKGDRSPKRRSPDQYWRHFPSPRPSKRGRGRTSTRGRACAELAPAHGNLGLLFTEQGRHEEALFCHERAVALNPRACESHLHLGVALAAAGHLARAETALRAALERDPGCAEALGQLGLVKARQGDQEGALRLHFAAAALRPDDPEVCNNLGNALRAWARQGGGRLLRACRASGA